MNLFLKKKIIETSTILTLFIVIIYLVSFLDLNVLTLKTNKEHYVTLDLAVQENEDLKVLVTNRHYTSPNLMAIPLSLEIEAPLSLEIEAPLEEKEKEQVEEIPVKEKVEPEEVTNQEVVPESEPVSDTTNYSLGDQIVEYAKQFVGNPYVYGGTSLTNGADCSGFTMSVFANFGISIARSSYDQINSGYQVSLDNIAPGDLVLSGYDGVISHSSMYIGNNQIIHSLNENVGIVITDMYIMPIIAVVRVI